MTARWLSFAVGLWLVLAPLVLGHSTAAAVLHDVVVGLLVCLATLAALDWPPARVAQALLAGWLLAAPRVLEAEAPLAAASHVAAGAALLLLAAIPGGRLASRGGAAAAGSARAA